jgi:hypothetical protein
MNLKNIFKRRKFINSDELEAGTLKVISLNPDAETIDDALGITKERAKVLADKVRESYHTSGDLSEAGAKISEICKHPNELFFASFVLVNAHHKHQAMGGLMEGLLGKMMGGKDK